MNILKKFFKEHFEEMIYIQHPRDSVIENVEKMINCGDPSFGGAMYVCPSCGNYKYVPFRCHSRFFPTCGNMYSIDRTTSMSFKIINVQHRHCVFTIARELRSLERITFHYNRHEDEKLVIETVPVLDFIAQLTQHIPEKHFKMIRYYGIYARHRKSDKYLRRSISREKHKILLSFGYDPLKCPSCGTTMLFLELYFNHKPVPLHKLYEKVMRKHQCRSPGQTHKK